MWARNGRWILPEMSDFHIAFRNLLHAANLRHGTDGFTSPPKEGVLRNFFRPELAKLGTKGQHATSRPPKPLSVILWIWQHVSTSEGHLGASSIKYIKELCAIVLSLHYGWELSTFVFLNWEIPTDLLATKVYTFVTITKLHKINITYLILMARTWTFEFFLSKPSRCVSIQLVYIYIYIYIYIYVIHSN